jgi:rhodanese-related sulfurtransferase
MHNDYPSHLIAEFFKAKAAAYLSPMGFRAMLERQSQDVVLVDVRLPGPQVTWRIPGAMAIPTPAIEECLDRLPKDKLIVLYCWDTWCGLATHAALTLLAHGYRVKELSGGIAAWQTLHLPQEPITPPVCSC